MKSKFTNRLHIAALSAAATSNPVQGPRLALGKVGEFKTRAKARGESFRPALRPQ